MKKLIPPTFFAVCIIVMLLLHMIVPMTAVLPVPFNMLGLVPIGIGLGLTLSVNHLFAKMDTEIHTFKKPRKLVTSNWFCFTRNPIYLGFSVALFGVWMLLGTLSSVVVPAGFILVVDVWYIRHEEKILEDTFGEDFLNYKKKVGRWI